MTKGWQAQSKPVNPRHFSLHQEALKGPRVDRAPDIDAGGPPRPRHKRFYHVGAGGNMVTPSQVSNNRQKKTKTERKYILGRHNAGDRPWGGKRE